MKEITIISGKGGTGKTSITAAIASLAEKAVICDNDVDAANLHLLLQPTEKESQVFYGSYVAEINTDECTRCGLCIEHCRFDAITVNTRGDYEINPFTCEGCRLCERICPDNAITSERSSNNHWFVSATRFGPFLHASMGAGEENSGKLVSLLRNKARDIAKVSVSRWIINDGPPGIGCEAISSITGADMVIIVTEPSLAAFHDLERVAELVQSFNIPAFAIINKMDINPPLAGIIKNFLKDNDLELIAEIPFNENMVNAMVQGKTIVEYDPESEITKILQHAWKEMEARGQEEGVTW
ncbi:MAG: P-loop NTPase [Bacteroidales bacterium]|nr:P-loop NTPase [Bacteroidales bacterium]